MIKAEDLMKETLDARIQKLKFTHNEDAKIEQKKLERVRADLV